MKKNSMLKKFVAALLAAATVASAGIGASAAVITDFTDVNPKAWYYEAVEYAVDNSLFSGTSKTTFSPGGAMTRGMFVTVLGRKAGIDESQYLAYRFTDVKKGEYYAPYVEWAARYGIVSGISDTTFAPNKSITREQMAAILYRYAKATDNDTEYTTGKYTSFPDLGSVSGFAVEPLMWATDKGIIKGSDGKLNPKGTATRAQVAQVFLSSKDILTKTEVTAEPIPVPVRLKNPVPISALANYANLKKGLTDAQFQQVYDIAVNLMARSEELETLEQKAYFAARIVACTYKDYTYTMEGPYYATPYGVFVDRKASCAGYARAVGLCLNILGIPYEHVNEGLYSHQWCRVRINGVTWNVDGYTEPGGGLSATDFGTMTMEGTYLSEAVSPELPEFKCTLEYDLEGEKVSGTAIYGQGEKTVLGTFTTGYLAKIEGAYQFYNNVWSKKKDIPANVTLTIEGGMAPYTVTIRTGDNKSVIENTSDIHFEYKRGRYDNGKNYDVMVEDFFGRAIAVKFI